MPWQPSGAEATIEATFGMESWPEVVFAGTVRLRPVTLAAVTLIDGHPVGFADTTAPAVIDVKVTAYGFGFVRVK
jgi:hypothetical protein